MEKKRIIWVDDLFEGDYNLLECVEILSREGFIVDVCTTVSDFMDKFNGESKGYACAIIDLVMPDPNTRGDFMNTGRNLINQVRAISQDINIIAYTHMTIDDDVQLEFEEKRVKYLYRRYPSNIVEVVKNTLNPKRDA